MTDELARLRSGLASAQAQVREMVEALAEIKACERYLNASFGEKEPARFLQAGLEDAIEIATKALSTPSAAVAQAEREVIEAALAYSTAVNEHVRQRIEYAKADLRTAVAIYNAARASAKDSAAASRDCDRPGCGEVVADTPDGRWVQGKCQTCGKWFCKGTATPPAPGRKHPFIETPTHLIPDAAEFGDPNDCWLCSLPRDHEDHS